MKSWHGWVAIFSFCLALSGCGTRKDSLAADIVAAAPAHPEYSSHWKPVIRDLAQRYVATLKTQRPDSESGRIASKAIADGCRDPFVRYCAFQHYYRNSDVADEKHAREGLAILNELQVAGYPSVVRAYAATRARSVWTMAFGREKELPTAKHLSDMIWQETLGALQDRSVPEWMNRSLGNSLQDIWWRGSSSGSVAQRLDADFSKRYGNCASLHYLRGRRAILSSYEVRGSNYAMSAQQREEYQRVYQNAKEEFERAWKSDPHDASIAGNMIIVCANLKLPRPEMEQWYQRGLSTNQDASQLAEYKLLYLSPSWQGTFQQQLEFARECLDHPDQGWSTAMGLWLTHVEHQKLESLPVSYFAQPGVWADIKLSLSRSLDRNPESSPLRMRYAYHAWLAQDWVVLKQQLALVDVTTVDLRLTGGPPTLKQMIADSQAHDGKPPI